MQGVRLSFFVHYPLIMKYVCMENEIMNISFDKISNNPNVDKVTTAYGNAARETENKGGIYTVDISGMVMDNNAYTGHGRTAEDVMQEAGCEDLTWQRNYMVVMSNSMSDEDFAKLQEEGFHPGSTEIETVVTIVDQIKAVMAQSGMVVTGYTDTLDRDTLIQITGNQGLAEEMIKQFHAKDVPVTRENAEAVLFAMVEGAQLTAPQDGAVKYLVENGMEPTVDNLYLAEHSGALDAGRQARGYYAVGSGSYLAKKADAFDWQKLAPQMQKIIEEAGLETEGEQVMEEARWLLEKGVELTPENLSRLHKIRQIPVPAEEEQLVQAAVTALADGKSAKAAIPGETQTLMQKAVRICEEVNSLTAEAADLTTAEGKRLTLRNLLSAQYRLNQGAETGAKALENLQARRQLEEIRLQMTAEANRMLLKSGYSIDTAPIEELLTALKQAEQAYQSALFEETDGAKAESKASLYDKTMDMVSYLQGAPAAVIGRIASEYGNTTLSDVEKEAKSLEKAYKQAGESYETLMTAPRADLGDSIRKAFCNVDDILKDLKLEATQDNQRAVRILGYNSMEITQENVDLIKSADSSVQRLLKKMTPASVLQMIRDGENPLNVTMEELGNYLDHQSDTPQQETDRYSKFLYKLEKNGDISEEEKESFIGIYRMIRTLEKNDGAAIGALVNQGTELTFGNLLTAVRSRKRGAMDYKVDDSFGGVDRIKGETKSISGQIQAAYTYADNLLHEISEGLAPEILKEVPVTPEMTLEQTAEAFRAAAETQGREDAQAWTAEREWQKEQADYYRQAARVEEGVLETLLEAGQPVTADNLTAAQAYIHERGSAWKTIYDRSVKNGKEKVLDKKAEQLVERFSSKEEAKEAYSELSGEASELLMQEIEQSEGYVDVRQLALLHKQLSFCQDMANEESYEIPVSIDGELTSINLRIRSRTSKNSGEAGNVTVTCRTETFGNTAGEFTINTADNKSGAVAVKVCGYIACEKEEGREYFTKVKSGLEELLSQNGWTESRIQVVSGTTVRLEKFGQSGRSEIAGQNGIAEASAKPQDLKENDSKMLYQAAKLFLTALKQSERG